MGCCYSVSMSLRATSKKDFVRASHEFYADEIEAADRPLLYSRRDVEGIAGFVVLDDYMSSPRYAHDEIRIKRYKTGQIHLDTAFNASYGWECTAMNWFEAVAPFLSDNSWMTIYGEGNGVVRMRVKNGRTTLSEPCHR